MVGRNGVGKSILTELIAGEKLPYSGSIARFCDVGLLSQIGADNKFFQYETISDFLGIKEKLLALERIAQGGCDPVDFDLISDRWLLREEMEKQLSTLGLTSDLFLPCKALSGGGQLMRLALHQLFQSGYGYLILDEPGNYLDEQGKHWLVEQMKGFPGGVLIISHNRDMLRCVDKILELTSLGMSQYGGAYDIYAQQRAAEVTCQEQRLKYAKHHIRKIRQTAQKNREKAEQRSVQGKKLSQSGKSSKDSAEQQKTSRKAFRGQPGKASKSAAHPASRTIKHINQTIRNSKTTKPVLGKI